MQPKSLGREMLAFYKRGKCARKGGAKGTNALRRENQASPAQRVWVVQVENVLLLLLLLLFCRLKWRGGEGGRRM